MMKPKMSWNPALFIVPAIFLFLATFGEFFKIGKLGIDDLNITLSPAIFLFAIFLLIGFAIILAGLVAWFLFLYFIKRKTQQNIILQKSIIDVILKSVTSLLNEHRFIMQIWSFCAGENHPNSEEFKELLMSGREALSKVCKEVEDIEYQLDGTKKLSLHELENLERQTSVCLFALLGARCSRKRAVELQRVISWQEFHHYIPNEILVNELCRNTPQFSEYLNLDIPMKMLFAKNIELDLDIPGVLDSVLGMMFLLKEIINFNQR